MPENPHTSFDDIRLESWEESALDRTEPITDKFNEQARGDGLDSAQDGADDGSSSDSATDQSSAASVGVALEPWEDAAASTGDDAAHEAGSDYGYDGPGL